MAQAHTQTPSNDQLSPIPRTEPHGPALRFDFPGLVIGTAEYEEGPTGCTVFRFPHGADAAADVRGGLVGMTQTYERCSAICLAGGSLLGLEAASGVAAGIFAQRGYSLDAGQPQVNGAIIYDFGRRSNTIYPDRALGRAALEAAQPGVFPLGRQGVGRWAGVGSAFGHGRAESSGQGGAFRQVAGIKLAVFTVVNALGCVFDRTGRVVRGNRVPETGVRESPVASLEAWLALPPTPRGEHTTLTVLVTNHKLDRASLTQLGRQVHSSLARAIQPFHTEWDGDVLFTVTTGEVDSSMELIALGVLASELAWDAVLAAVADYPDAAPGRKA